MKIKDRRISGVPLLMVLYYLKNNPVVSLGYYAVYAVPVVKIKLNDLFDTFRLSLLCLKTAGK
ncbi:MAG: hypothetical protein WBL67_12715 [Nitrososphaeraceae archaeon]